MINIILISHGYYAREALASAEMIVGKQEDCYSISVTDDKGLDRVEQDLLNIYSQLEDKRKVLILCDIFGGTPSNTAVRFLMNHPEIQVISGFNLPMLLDIFLSRDSSLKDIASRMNTVYTDTMVDINKLLSKQEEEELVIEESIEL
ncbi:PTS sugar transporter subunit IIA [Jeotgalibaca sp. MA1X17-3]|uniref:PTS sugar transporter subunit IIA n=1 Tax=Jeotgalibaca sp. MA1X17-3 TaxID=2908211 RepID=UPI001F3E046B|nr:PTS sugar transporter subunit IIA [Jeotgalibaca sp. MA1X17-3]UJF16420.1 PTS sugar transporter subunit IIA [Jeotgalibaca sp. MA1X17-3]